MNKENADIELGLGCLDGLFARRLARRGPAEAFRMVQGKSPWFRAVVEYKWNNAPDVKLARKINRLLRWIKFVDASQYKQYKKQILSDIKSGSGGNLDGYREFVRLINNPKIGKNYEGFVSELIDNSPKTRDIFLKLSERDVVLNYFRLDYRSDYMVNDSKTVDIWIAKAMFLYTFLRYDSELMWKCMRIGMRLRGDIARLNVAKVLWGDYPNVVNMYQSQLDAQQELYDTAIKSYQNTIDETRKLYKETEQNIDKKHKNIARYKELIQTGLLQPFKKK